MVKATSSAPSQRMLRVGEMVRAALTKVLQRADMVDPALENAVISVTEVRMSPDLKIANAYVTALGQTLEQGDVVKALNKSAKFIRKRLTPELRHMKYMPDVRFRDDTSFENFNKIDALLNSDVVQRDVLSGHDDDIQDDDA